MTCLVVVGIGALLLQTPLQAALFGANAGGFSQYLTAVPIPFYLLFLIYIIMPRSGENRTHRNASGNPRSITVS